jgi:hypothetical protein
MGETTNNGLGYLTDPDGKPSDTRLKSWVLFMFAIIVGLVILIMWGLDKGTPTIEQYQVPFLLFTICLVGGASWQLFGKVLEVMAGKRIK